MEQATARTQRKAAPSVVERFTLKAFVEACLVLEEGVASLKDIETGMMMGAGILPNFWSIRALIAPFSVLERCQDWDLNQSLPKTVSAEWAAWLIRSWSKRRFNSHERLAVKLSSAANSLPSQN